MSLREGYGVEMKEYDAKRNIILNGAKDTGGRGIKWDLGFTQRLHD